MAVRLTVGALRAWVVFTLIWLSVAGWINYGPQPPGPWDLFADLPFPRTESACREAAAKDAAVVVRKCIENARIQSWHDGERMAWTVAPPIILLVVGLLVGWVAAGFRSSTET